MVNKKGTYPITTAMGMDLTTGTQECGGIRRTMTIFPTRVISQGNYATATTVAVTVMLKTDTTNTNTNTRQENPALYKLKFKLDNPKLFPKLLYHIQSTPRLRDYLFPKLNS